MGGRVGLKGTDGVANEAQAAGAEPIAGPRASIFARTFVELSKPDAGLRVRWITWGGAMGADPRRAAGGGAETGEVRYRPAERTTAGRTLTAVAHIVDGG